MRKCNLLFGCGLILGLAHFAHAQIVLTGSSYGQNFNGVGAGIPSGWAVYTSATDSTLGSAGSFSSAVTNWNATVADNNQFRNVAGFSTTNQGTGSSTGSQAVYTDRAFGWRASTAGTSRGALTAVFQDTLGYRDFSVSADFFTGNDTGSALTVSFEYRVGQTGSFTSIGTYTTTALANGVTTLAVSGVSLVALSDRAENVYFRVRGTASASNTTHTVVVDNFVLNYAPIPEPAAFSAILGVVGFAGVLARRRRRGPRGSE